MSQAFKRQLSRNIGTTPVVIGSYSVPAGVNVTAIGLSVANTCQAALTCDVYLFDGTNKTYYVKGAPIGPGGALVIFGGDQKHVLQPGDTVMVVVNLVQALLAGTVTPTADAILSVLELS